MDKKWEEAAVHNEQSYEAQMSSFEELDDDKDITQPYNPRSIDIAQQNIAFATIISRLEHDEIDLQPDYQRKGGLWNEEKESQLIESLMLKIPLPVFYFDGSDENRWLVIDGLQRLTAFKRFFVDKTLHLKGMEFLTEFEGKNVEEIPRVILRRIYETQIVCYIIKPGTPIDLKFTIFKRLNTGGLMLTSQEIRHALYQGFSTEYLKRLSQSKTFQDATDRSISADRMEDRELILRFLAFYDLGAKEYDGDMNQFLNREMDYINKEYNETYANSVEKTFNEVIDISTKIFDKYAFRRIPDWKKRRPINKALFEVWCYLLARMGPDEYEAILRKKEKFLDAFVELNNNEEFVLSLKNEKKASVRTRLEKLDKLLKEAIQ